MTGLLTRRWQLMLAALFGLSIGGLLLIRPQLSALAETQTAAERWQARLHDSEAAKAAIPTQRNALSQWHRRIGEHRVQIPIHADVTDLLANITRRATENGVRIRQIKPSADQPGDDESRQRISLVTQGRWPQSMGFLHQLMTSATALTIEEFAAYPLNANLDDRGIALEITLIGHSAPNAENTDGEQPGLAQAPGQSHHIAALPAALKKNPFANEGESIALSNHSLPFSYAGRIQVGQTTWALLMDEHGVIHRQRIGAEFNNGWRLVNLDDTSVYLKDPQGQTHPIALRNSRQQRD